ncbi:DegV family protein [Fictibacillus nanhaiensis]|uniref:DegV family protein n=1 Tax=Fictibacillus nanhaiensis TaxID=742169 RepID=UPI00204091AA|nr:DegV family protein [Fictibacillus nanhaiensis]MCM3733767.1 DegV family protein [Fictibacillus nanhaiensis]
MIHIITDTGSDLPKQLLDEYDITMLPLVVQLNNEEYLDRSNIEPKQLYTHMKDGAVPKTSQVPPALIKETLSSFAKNGKQAIYITLSSGISGTYQTAVLMKNEVLEEYPDAQIEVFDSQAASLGYGLMVYEAAKESKEGKTFNEIMQTLQHYQKHLESIFTVDDLEYLLRGGRVSKTAAVMGALLKIKPVLHMEDGKLFPLEKLRGKKKVLGRMVEIMKERAGSLDDITIGISHADDTETAQALKELIIEETGNRNILITMIGCAIGAHAGPGTIALFFLNTPNKVS